jgi:hypothetical protein
MHGSIAPAPPAVSVGGYKRIAPIEEPAHTGHVIKITDLAENAARRERMHGGFKSSVYAAVGGYQVHSLHAGFVGDSRKVIEHTRDLKISCDRDARAGHRQQPLRLSGAKRAVAVKEQDISSGRLGMHNSWHRILVLSLGLVVATLDNRLTRF